MIVELVMVLKKIIEMIKLNNGAESNFCKKCFIIILFYILLL